MIEIILLLFGLFFGSFLNVLIDRLPRGEKFATGRSHCDFCGHVLSWYDLIPLFSYLFLLGKCRYCRKFIGWKYPVIELTTGVLFAATWVFAYTSLPVLFLLLGIVSALIVIFYTDLFSGIIPDAALIVLLVLGVVEIIIERQNILPFLFAAIGAGVFFLIIFLITRGRGMGFGDVKYAFVMGVVLGFPYIITGLYVAFLTGALVALILIVVRKKRFKQTIPLGPFLVLGTVSHIFWGNQLWQAFLHILGL